MAYAPATVLAIGPAATASLSLHGSTQLVVRGPSAAVTVGRQVASLLAPPSPQPSPPPPSPSPPPPLVACAGVEYGGLTNDGRSGDWADVWTAAGVATSASGSTGSWAGHARRLIGCARPEPRTYASSL